MATSMCVSAALSICGIEGWPLTQSIATGNNEVEQPPARIVKKTSKKDDIEQKPLFVINYSNIPSCAHYGRFVQNIVEEECPEQFEFQIVADRSTCAKLILKISDDARENYDTIHSTIIGDPFIKERSQVLGNFSIFNPVEKLVKYGSGLENPPQMILTDKQ